MIIEQWNLIGQLLCRMKDLSATYPLAPDLPMSGRFTMCKMCCVESQSPSWTLVHGSWSHLDCR